MTVFIDTSALYALLDKGDQKHRDAQIIWENLLNSAELCVTSNYVLIESVALVQRRLGLDAVRDLQESLLPVFAFIWVDERLHQKGVKTLLEENRRYLSLVDCISFAVCHEAKISRVFAFDAHFTEQGFELLA